MTVIEIAKKKTLEKNTPYAKAKSCMNYLQSLNNHETSSMYMYVI